MHKHKHHQVFSIKKTKRLTGWFRKIIHRPNIILKDYIKAGNIVLDLGCGPGFFTVPLAKMVGKKGKVFAVDIQKEMFELVKINLAKNKLEDLVVFHLSKSDRIDLKQSFDFILLFYVAHEFPDTEKLFKELHLLLKPGGKILLSEPKFVVSKSEFKRTLSIASNNGFYIINTPKILLSRSVLLENK